MAGSVRPRLSDIEGKHGVSPEVVGEVGLGGIRGGETPTCLLLEG